MGYFSAKLIFVHFRKDWKCWETDGGKGGSILYSAVLVIHNTQKMHSGDNKICLPKISILPVVGCLHK